VTKSLIFHPSTPISNQIPLCHLVSPPFHQAALEAAFETALSDMCAAASALNTDLGAAVDRVGAMERDATHLVAAAAANQGKSGGSLAGQSATGQESSQSAAT
jgi:hypothetical protein